MTVVNVAYPFAPVSRGTAGGAEQVLAALDEALVAAGHRSIVVACEGSEVQGELVATPRVDGVLDEAACHAARARHRAVIESVVGDADVVHFHGLDFDAYRPSPGLRPPSPRVAGRGTSGTTCPFARFAARGTSGTTCPSPRVSGERVAEGRVRGRAVATIVTVHLPPQWYPAAALSHPETTYVCVSHSERAAFSGEAVVIANGVDLSDRAASRPPHASYLLCLGRICEEKGFHDAVDAAKRADTELLIAGECFAYDEHRRYFENTLKRRLDERRRFIGPVGMPAKRELLAGARALLVPSTVAETSSLVAMEALACGTPVIAYRSGALPEIVDDGVTGFLVDGVDGLVDAIGRIETIDSADCRRAAEERFDVRRMTARYLALYAATIMPGARS